MSSNVRNRLKFGNMSRKDLLCTKMLKKNGYREFHHRGTLRVIATKSQRNRGHGGKIDFAHTLTV